MTTATKDLLMSPSTGPIAAQDTLDTLRAWSEAG